MANFQPLFHYSSPSADNFLQPFVSDNMVLAAGKYLISEAVPNKNFEVVKTILEAISSAIKAPVSGSVDTKRLALVVVRTISRVHFEVSFRSYSLPFP